MRLKSPKRQSNTSSSTSMATGVMIAPTISGSWCARKVSVAPLDSFTIRRTLPLPRPFIKPTGSDAMWRMVRLRMLLATRKADMCEHISPPK